MRELVFVPQNRYEKDLDYRVAAFEIAAYRPRYELIYLVHSAPGRQVGRFSLHNDRTLFVHIRPSNQADGCRYDSGSACQRPRPDQLAAARSVRHKARRADLRGSGLEPVERGEHYGLGSMRTDGRHTAGLAGLPVCGRRTRRSTGVTVTASSAPSVPSSLSGQWQRTRADLRLSPRAIGSPDTTEIRLAASI